MCAHNLLHGESSCSSVVGTICRSSPVAARSVRDAVELHATIALSSWNLPHHDTYWFFAIFLRVTHLVDNRTGQLVFQPPPTEDVSELVDRACAFIDRGMEHPAIGAAWIHVAVAAIHPFTDGNGRAARVVASLAMYRGGFKLPEFTSLEEWWGRHLSDYYASFHCLGATFDPTTDVTPFIRAHLEAQLHQVRALDLRERVQHRIWTAIEEAVTAAGLDPRLANAVWDAFFGRSVTPRYYRPLADVSVATATKDLAVAVASGLLRPVGRARSRTYQAGEALYARIGTALGVPVTESGEPARGTIIGELTKRVASEVRR